MGNNFFKTIQTFLLILLIVLLSLVMGVVGFGGPTTEGCGQEGPGYAVQIYDENISTGEFRAAYTLTGFVGRQLEFQRARRLREYTLNGIIERELLVREGRRLGFAHDEEEVMREIAEEEVILLNGPVDAPAGYPSGRLAQRFRNQSGSYSAEYLRRIVQYQLGRSIAEFAEWQVREMIAEDVRRSVNATVAVSSGEVWDAYVQETDRAQLSVVRFQPAYYRDTIEPTDDEITAWMSSHEEEVTEEYARTSHSFTNLPEQFDLRHILIRATEDEDEDEARARAEALLARVQAGESLADLASEHSEDRAENGGHIEWERRDNLPTSLAEALDAQEAPGLLSEVVQSPAGFHVVELIGQREGDIPEEDARRTVAGTLYRAARGRELAEEEANRANAYLREGHTMEELDERLLYRWAELEPPPEEGDEPAEEGDEPAEEEEPPTRASNAPQVAETHNFSRSELAGAFDTGPIARAAFELSLDNPLSGEPVESRDSFVVFQLIERTHATEEGYDDATSERIHARLLVSKQGEAIAAYVGRLRAIADAEGAIRINQAVLRYGDEDDDEEGSSEEE